MSLSDYVYQNQHELLFVCTFASILLFMLIEEFGETNRKSPSHSNSVNNLGLALINLNVVAYCLPPLAAWLLASWPTNWLAPMHNTGLAWYWLFIPGFLLIELVSYGCHRLSHRWPLLWRFHAIHHSDTNVNPSTGVRHHIGEVFILFLISTPIYVAIGVPLMVAIWHPILMAVVQAVSHSRLLLPEGLNRYLRYLIVTPNYHRIHHCADQPLTDSNYAAMLPLFDYVFGTAKTLPNSQLKELKLGLEYRREDKENRLDKLLSSPFRPHMPADQ